MTKANEPTFPNCRKDAESIMNHNKGIFHIKQCPACYSSETIEPDKERRQLAGQAMMGLLANPEYNNPRLKNKMVTVPNLAKTAIDYADALIAQLEKTEK